MILKHGDKDLIDPSFLDGYQLAEWEDEAIQQKNETSIAREATFDGNTLAASLHFDQTMSEEDVDD